MKLSRRFENLFGSLLVFCLGGPCLASTCFDNAGLRHGVAPALLVAIAQQESAMNPKAINRNRDGSRDMGLMQINSLWLPALAGHGISAEALWDPCTNIEVGAWILSSNFRRYGLNWNGLGAYNAGSIHLRAGYANKIIRRLKSLMAADALSNCHLTSPSQSEINC